MPGTAAGTRALQAAHGRLRDLLRLRLLRALLARDDHVRLQDHAFEVHAVAEAAASNTDSSVAFVTSSQRSIV